MCWLSNKIEKTILRRKRKVFKICKLRNGKIYGYVFNDFSYELNKTYETEIKIKLKKVRKSLGDYKYGGFEGFHSYSADSCTTEKKEWTYSDDSNKNVVGYETLRINSKQNSFYCRISDYAIKTGSTKDEEVVIVEGYIPKGGICYENEIHEIISNKIILTNIIKIGET